MAAAAGVNIETLRYYERRGLLAEPARSPGGHRLYPPEAVTVLRVVKAAQRLGFTLDEVADLLELGRHRHGKRVDAGLQQRAAGEAGRGRGAHRRPGHHPRQPDRRTGCRVRRPDRVRVGGVLSHPVRGHHHPSRQRLGRRAVSGLRDRHLVGGAAAACAVCCAAPVVGFLGVAGFAATAITLAFAGVVFAVVVGLAAVGGGAGPSIAGRGAAAAPRQMATCAGRQAELGPRGRPRHSLTGARLQALRLGDCCP